MFNVSAKKGYVFLWSYLLKTLRSELNCPSNRSEEPDRCPRWLNPWPQPSIAASHCNLLNFVILRGQETYTTKHSQYFKFKFHWTPMIQITPTQNIRYTSSRHNDQFREKFQTMNRFLLPWRITIPRLFPFWINSAIMNLIHTRRDSLDGGSVHRKAATYTGHNKHRRNVQ